MHIIALKLLILEQLRKTIDCYIEFSRKPQVHNLDLMSRKPLDFQMMMAFLILNFFNISKKTPTSCGFCLFNSVSVALEIGVLTLLQSCNSLLWPCNKACSLLLSTKILFAILRKASNHKHPFLAFKFVITPLY